MTDNILHVKIVGEGAPLIVLHGFFGTGDNWLSLAKNWGESRKVFLVDIRNHGRSFHAAIHDYPSMTDDLLRLMDHYGLENAEVLGHSMGGKLAMYFALNYPEKVNKLIVVDIAPKRYRRGHDDIIEALNELPISEMSSRKEAEAFLMDRLSDPGVVLFLMKNLTRNSDNGFVWKMNLSTLTSQYHNILVEIESEHNYNKDSLFIKGGNSRYIKPEDEEMIKALFPKSRMIEIQDAGHWVHSEQSEAFNTAVTEFLVL